MFGCSRSLRYESESQSSTPVPYEGANPEGSIDLTIIVLLSAGLLIVARWIWKGNNS